MGPILYPKFDLEKSLDCEILLDLMSNKTVAQFMLPDESVYWIFFLISQPKHMLWVLKEPSQ